MEYLLKWAYNHPCFKYYTGRPRPVIDSVILKQTKGDILLSRLLLYCFYYCCTILCWDNSWLIDWLINSFIDWTVHVAVSARYYQRCSRRHNRRRRQPRRDSWVRQTVQDTSTVSWSDADSGWTGSQRHWRTFLQPVRYLPVCRYLVFPSAI